MKELIQNIPLRRKVLGILSAVCLLFIGIVSLGEKQLQKELYDQQMAKRWSKQERVSQISVFYADGAAWDVNAFKQLEQGVNKALEQASVVSENENARLWIDAVSRQGKVTLTNERANIELNAVGVEGEFFQFHPQKLVCGSLFREDSMMQDGIVIDTDTAWQLFGSSDVAGMQVMIGSVPHYITGVIERSKGRLDEAAGLDRSVCYLSLESLEAYGNATGGFTYEIVMPDPIKNFAYATLQEAVGTENEDAVIVENSARYRVSSLIKVIRDFGIRSMSKKGIVYPYWENKARAYEDIFALTGILKVVLGILPALFLTGGILSLWKKRKWRLKGIWRWCQDKIYEAETKRAVKKKNKKGKE